MEGHFVTSNDLDRRFSHHPPPDTETGDRHSAVRQILRDAAEQIVTLTGAPSREQSLSLTALEESMMWANADIARKGADVAASRQL